LRNAITKHRLIILSAFSTSLLFADGGAVQLQRQAGPFLITVFASPVPARVGPVDLSVLVQDRVSLRPVLDTSVSVQVDDREIPATHAQAQNKLLYAAAITANSQGPLNYKVSVLNNSLAGTLTIEPSAPKLQAYWTYLALPPFAICLFTLHQLLKRQKGRSPSASGAALGRDQLK
jgi:hypothetical protein